MFLCVKKVEVNYKQKKEKYQSRKKDIKTFRLTFFQYFAEIKYHMVICANFRHFVSVKSIVKLIDSIQEFHPECP